METKDFIKLCNSCKRNVFTSISDLEDGPPVFHCRICDGTDVSPPDPLKGYSVFEVFLGMHQPDLSEPENLGIFMSKILAQESQRLILKYDSGDFVRSDLEWMVKAAGEVRAVVKKHTLPEVFDYIVPCMDQPRFEDLDITMSSDDSSVNEIQAIVRDLMGRGMSWPNAQELGGDEFVDQAFEIVNSCANCSSSDVVTQVTLKIWRELRGE